MADRVFSVNKLENLRRSITQSQLSAYFYVIRRPLPISAGDDLNWCVWLKCLHNEKVVPLCRKHRNPPNTLSNKRHHKLPSYIKTWKKNFHRQELSYSNLTAEISAQVEARKKVQDFFVSGIYDESKWNEGKQFIEKNVMCINSKVWFHAKICNNN